MRTAFSLLSFVIILLSSCTRKESWQVYDEHNTPMKTGWVRQIILENSELGWVGTYGDGLYRIMGGQWGKVQDPFKGEYVLCLKEKGNTLWIGTAREGAYRFSKGSFAQWDTANGLCDNNVWDIGFGLDGEVLFGSRYRGITRMKQGVFSCLSRGSGLPDNEITAIAEDSRGRSWIGTAQSGLYGISENDTIRLNRRSGLSGNYVRAILCDSTAHAVGSWDGGLDTLMGGKWEHVASVGKPVVVLARDNQGRLWAGTWGSGVYFQSGDGWRRLSISNSGLPDDHVIDIKFNSRGDVFFATNKGVAKYSFQ